MADQDEIDDWLDSDSDDDAGGDAGVALGTPNDSFVADLMTPGTTPESLRKTDAKTEPAPAPAPVPENTSASTVEPEPAREDLAPAPEEARPAAEGTASPVPPPLAFDPPSPAPVAVTIPDHDGVELAEDEMQTLALSPGASTAPPSAFAPADLRDGPSIIQPPRATATMNAEIETAEEDDERGDEDDADGFDEGDSYGSGAYGDDLGDDDVLDKIGEWGERLTKFTNEGLSRVRRTGENIARSDYAAKAIEAAKGVGKELAELGSHIAGDDLTPGETDRHEGRRTVTRNSADAAGGDAPEAGELDAGASLWGTFAGFAKKAADAIETAAAKAADAIEKPPADETPDKGGLRKLASRSTELVSNLASQLEAGAFELLGAHPALSGDFRDDAAAEIEAALDELGLRERVDAMETAADEGMAACEAIRSALASDEDRVAFDDAVFVAREILDLHDGTLHDGTLHDGTPKAPSAPSAPSETETDGASHPLITEASALREGGVNELLEIAGDVAAALERRAADAVAAVRGAEGADAVVSAATRLRLLDEADELVAEMRGECARRVAAFALVVVSHLRTAQSGEGFVGGENLGSSVAARAGETRAAVDGALRELEGYAKDAAEAMRAATADVDAALGAPTEPSDGSGSAPPVASVGAAAAEACGGTWVPIARDVVADAAQCVVFPLVAASRSGGTEAAAAGGGE